MNRNTFSFSFLVLTLAALGGCSSKPPAQQSDKAPAAPDKIQGKALVLEDAEASEAALNAGGPSVYLVEGLHRYRLVFKTAVEVVKEKEYVAEGVYAQKAIEEIGDPDQGKNGYPLSTSCDRVVKMAWSGLPFDIADGYASALRAKLKRFPARAMFLVTRIEPVTPKNGPNSAEPTANEEGKEKHIPEVAVPGDKQRVSLIESPAAQTAPLWEPAGGTVRCKVAINPEGKVSELDTGIQLCEAVQWSQFRYKPTIQRGHAVRVKTEVEVRFEPRK
jgi:hypothetical protein